MTGKHIAVAAAFSLVLVGSGLARLRPTMPTEESAGGMQMDMPGTMDEGVPSYHAYALQPPIPVTLDPKQFPDAINRNVYSLAATIKPVLYQQPCYCYCDRHFGHKSLLDCFVTTHGSECDVCLREAVLAYQLTKKGKTPAQIRVAIIRGDWKSLDMAPYAKGMAVR